MTILSDNFDRTSSDTVGGGWTEHENTNSKTAIGQWAAANQLNCYTTSTGAISDCWVSQSHGTITFPVSLSFQVMSDTSVGTSDSGIAGIYGDGSTFGNCLGLKFHPGLNGNHQITVNGTDTNFSYDWSGAVSRYVWIDYTPNGSNVDFSIYISTTSTKPGSATATATNKTIPAQSNVHFGANITSDTNKSIELDNFLLDRTPQTLTTTITDGMIHGDAITTIRTRFATIVDGMIHGDTITTLRTRFITILDGMIHGDTISVSSLWSRVQKIVSSWTNLSKATPFLLDSCTATSNSVLQLYNGLDFIGVQSFTGGGRLARAKFNLRKVGSPTGSLNAVLYAHSGTFGNGGAPTGAILATSATTLSAASLTTSSVEYTFDFTDQYQMTTGTYYFIGVYFTSTSSDASNYVGMDRTTVVASHAGNLARYGLHPALNWTSSASDMIFKVYSTFGNLSKNNATWTNQSR